MVDTQLLSNEWLKNSLNDVDNKILKSLFMIRVHGGAGTGVLLDTGHIVTCAHVIGNNDCYNIKLYNFILNNANAANNKDVSVKEIIYDYERDLAYLIPDETINMEYALALGDETKFKVGSTLKSWGYPFGIDGPDNGLTPLLMICYLSGFSDHITKSSAMPSNQKFKYMVINGIISKGNSGGPIFEYNGSDVIGIITNKCGIPEEIIMNTLKEDYEVDVDNYEDVLNSKKGDNLLKQFNDLTQIMIGKAISASEIKKSMEERKINPILKS